MMGQRPSSKPTPPDRRQRLQGRLRPTENQAALFFGTSTKSATIEFLLLSRSAGHLDVTTNTVGIVVLHFDIFGCGS
jgi:hypothetical protein